MGAPGFGIPPQGLGVPFMYEMEALGFGVLWGWDSWNLRVLRSMTQDIEVLWFSRRSVPVWGLLMPMHRA